MAQTTGTMKATSRQGTGETQTRSVTVQTSAGPPPVTIDFEASEEYFNDAKGYLGKEVVVTYSIDPGPPEKNTITGLKGTG